MKEYILDISELNIHRHKYLRQLFDFPAYYGNNLDALYDCLSDLGSATITVINKERARKFACGVLNVLEDVHNTFPNIILK